MKFIEGTEYNIEVDYNNHDISYHEMSESISELSPITFIKCLGKNEYEYYQFKSKINNKNVPVVYFPNTDVYFLIYDHSSDTLPELRENWWKMYYDWRGHMGDRNVFVKLTEYVYSKNNNKNNIKI